MLFTVVKILAVELLLDTFFIDERTHGTSPDVRKALLPRLSLIGNVKQKLPTKEVLKKGSRKNADIETHFETNNHQR